MAEMELQYQYGQNIKTLRDTMVERAASLQGGGGFPNILFQVTSETPFVEIASQWTFPWTYLPIGLTPIDHDYSSSVIDALGVLEYALYGLAVDYANIEFDTIPGCGTLGCDILEGPNGNKPGVTLCGHCIDSSDIGNIMFGLGGQARGYPFLGVYSSAATFNILSDWLPNPESITDLFNAAFSPDGRGLSLVILLEQRVL
jgi:hypothetical protein